MSTLARLATVKVGEVKGLAGQKLADLERASIRSVADLLLHVPRTYVDRSRITPLASVAVGEEVTVVGTVRSVAVRRPRPKMVIVEAELSDGSGRLEAVWFNQKFRARQLAEGTEVALSGKVERFRGRNQMKSPAVDVLSSESESLATARVVPIHPAVGKVGAGDMRRAIHNALRRSRPLEDPIPEDIRRRRRLLSRDRAVADIHFPATLDEVGPARHRLVFDELFRLEVALALRKRHQIEHSVGVAHELSGALVSGFLAGLPYDLTGAQRKVLDEIRGDLALPHPMHRLLQGEVGSGKTVVAVATLLGAIEGGWQGAVMAPTEVLAEQHYLGIVDLLRQTGLAAEVEGEQAALGMTSLFATDGPSVSVALLTGSRAILSHRPSAGRAEVISAIGSGEARLVVGTHALIQEGLAFNRLGMAVVDEQHRFGVAQRTELRNKAAGVEPDLLIMTATPIPRTLSMTLYGDLDVSAIDEMPPGRLPVATRALSPSQEEQAWQIVGDEVASGRQAFVVCPLVEDSPKIEAASATAELARLTGVLAGLRLGLIHGQLSSREKEAVMGALRQGEIDVLVSTTVIEVGIDVPNATVMVIEDAQRFGLSQLHQLRGRVGRGAHPGTCLLLADATTNESRERIAAMVATTDGFRLADEDLRIRGQGTVFGERQSGMADLRLADILRDFDTLVAARREAFALVDDDPELAGHPALAAEVQAMLGDEVDWLFMS